MSSPDWHKEGCEPPGKMVRYREFLSHSAILLVQECRSCGEKKTSWWHRMTNSKGGEMSSTFAEAGFGRTLDQERRRQRKVQRAQRKAERRADGFREAKNAWRANRCLGHAPLCQSKRLEVVTDYGQSLVPYTESYQDQICPGCQGKFPATMPWLRT